MTHTKCPVPHPAFDIYEFQISFSKYRGIFVTISMLGALYGVLAILSVISWYALLRRRNGKMQPTVIVLCLTILVLFASTTTYVVTSILNYYATWMDDLLGMTPYMWFSVNTDECWNYPLDITPGWTNSIEWVQACGSAATLTTNVTLGDAIVCWRACVVWHKNRVVKVICGIFLVATFSLGVLDAHQNCGVLITTIMLNGTGAQMYSPGALFEGIPTGLATCVLSLSTNILATLLVAYKAWQSRRHFRGYFFAKVRGSQVEKLLALLIESGAIYSAIWTVVVAFQALQYRSLQFGTFSISTLQYDFLDSFGLIMNGALVPVIAIYPTIIIVLVAFNRSHMEKGISQHLESMPTLHLAISANTITTSLHESHINGTSGVLAIDGEESENEDSLDDPKGRTSGEWKADGTIYPSSLPLGP